MDQLLKEKLRKLADKYENPEFIKKDPSQFLRWYPIEDKLNVEVAGFIAAMFAFGNRDQFNNRIRRILQLADETSGSIYKWIISDAYKTTFEKGIKKYYRFYSYDDVQTFLGEIIYVLKEYKTIGDCIKERWEDIQEAQVGNLDLCDAISMTFPISKLVPRGKTTGNKKIQMFLRWMVRQNSPVDVGFWDWYSPRDLLMPLDVHVMEEAKNLGLLPQEARATRKTAKLLAEAFKEIWPEDPIKGDYALFGLGVDENRDDK